MPGKEYKMAIKIAGQIENSFYNSTKLTKKELAAIARQASMTSASMGDRFARGLKDAAPVFSGIENIGKAAFSAVAEAAALSATAIAGVAAASVAAGSSFEAQMSTVKSLSGATAGEMMELEKLAADLGRRTQFTATEAGQAMEYMAMAGWKTEDMLNGMPGVLDLAAASGEDLAQTADIVTDAMTAFKMEADEVGHFSDVLAATATNSNTNVAMMGETFKYAAPLAGALGYEIEDVSLAIGLMANSSLKGSMSGTALRKMMTELAAGTSISSKKLGEYKISAQEADGSMRDFGEVIEDLRYAFHGMTDAEKEANAEAIAGKTAMNGLLAIVEASEKDYNKLAGAISNCNGAAAEMAEIRLDNLSGDVTIMQSALEGIGIQIYEGLKEPLREGVQWLTGLAGELSGSGFIEEISKQIPTAVRRARELAGAMEQLARPFLSIGMWLIENPGLIVGTIVSIGTAIETYKIASGIMSMAKALGALGPVGWSILGIAGVAGVIAGIGTAVRKSAEDAKRANLASHFGDISLSMSELHQIADGIIYSDSLGKVRESLSAFEELDGVRKSISESTEAIQKMNWKLSVGMDLSLDEMDIYQRELENYAEQSIQYLTDHQYAATLSVEALFGDSLEGQDFVSRMNDFYAGNQAELAGLGRKLNLAMTEAFNDGLLEPQEAEVIASIQAEMAEIEARIAEDKFQSRMEVLATKYGGQLDAESFQNLTAELAVMQEEAGEGYENAYQESLSEARNMDRRPDGSLDREKYNKDAKAAEKAYLDRKSEMLSSVQQFLIGKINDAYGEEISEALPKVDQYFNEMFDQSYAYNWQDKPGIMWNTIMQDIASNKMLGDKSTKDAFGELFNAVQPMMEQYQLLLTQYNTSGYTAPENITKDVTDIARIGALSGDKSSALTLAGSYVAESDERMEMLKNTTLPEETEIIVEGVRGGMEEVATAIGASQYLIDDALGNTYYNTKDTMQRLFGQEMNITMPFKVTTEVSIPAIPRATYTPADSSRPSSAGNVATANKPAAYATGGIIWNKTLSWFAEDCPEAAIPLDGSQNAINLWLKTGELLGVEGRDKKESFFSISHEIMDFPVPDKSSMKVEFKPVLNFYGGAPEKEDLDASFDDVLDRFDSVMQKWIRQRGRKSFR